MTYPSDEVMQILAPSGSLFVAMPKQFFVAHQTKCFSLVSLAEDADLSNLQVAQLPPFQLLRSERFLRLQPGYLSGRESGK
jgi:hypothetical protein